MNIDVRHIEGVDCKDITEIYSFASVLENTSQVLYLKDSEIFRILSGENMHTLVAVSNGSTIGHVSLFLQTNFRLRHCASIGMAVHPGFHRKGVGTLLLKSIIEEAGNWLNLSKLELDVHSENIGAIKLYESLGFVIEGEKRDHIFKSGQFVNVTIMSRLSS